MQYKAIVVLTAFLAVVNASTLRSTIDLNKLRSILDENVKSKDITSLYYAIKGLKLLKANLYNIPDVCETIKTSKYDLHNIEQIFYLSNAAALSGCLNSLSPNVLNAATAALDKADATIPDLYHAVYSLKALGKGSTYDKDEGLKNLIKLLKKDDSPANYGYVFMLCEHMGCESWTTSHAEGVLLAADESDNRALHFEGGLPVTCNILTTISRTYKAVNKPTPITADQRNKFAEYLVSRRTVTTAKGAALLLDAALALADEEPTPIAITIRGKNHITTDSDSIEISITDILGRPVRSIKPSDVVAQSGTRLSDDVVVLSKQPLSQRPNDPTTYILSLTKIKSQYGVYKIVINAGPKSASVNVAVLGEIKLKSLEVSVGDLDGSSSPKTITVNYPNKANEQLQADNMQKVALKFSILDKADKTIPVQQAFIRVGSKSSDDETFYIAEPDKNNQYKVEMNVASVAKHLSHNSGVYTLEVYLGDSAVSNPISWHVADVNFNFGKNANAVGEVRKTTSTPHRGPLPEIIHQFRAPEPRPPRFVSDVFAASCAAPLLLLLILWAKLGVNLSQIPLSLSVLVFHGGLGCSLGLYGLFWLNMTMFDTVRYLLPLGLVTFLSGHRLLRTLVASKNPAKQ